MNLNPNIDKDYLDEVSVLGASLAAAAMGSHTSSSPYVKYLLWGDEQSLKVIKDIHKLTTNAVFLLKAPTGVHFLYKSFANAKDGVDVVVEDRSNELGYSGDEMLSRFANDLTYAYDWHETIKAGNKLLVNISYLLNYLYNRKTMLDSHRSSWDETAAKQHAAQFRELDLMLVKTTCAGLLADVVDAVDELDVILKKPNQSVDPLLSDRLSTAAFLFTLCVNRAKRTYDIESLYDFSKDPEKPLQLRVISERIKKYRGF